MLVGEPRAQLGVAVALEEALNTVGERLRQSDPLRVREPRGRDAELPELGGNVVLAKSRLGIDALRRHEDELHRRAPRDERLERQDLEEHRAEREDVASLVEIGAAEGLLRGHVAGRSEDRADHGLPVRDLLDPGAAVRFVALVGLADLGQAPVEHVDLAELAEHQVLGLEVAVEHAPPMRVLDGEADLPERVEQLVGRVLADRVGILFVELPQDVGERPSADALHREVLDARRREAEVVDRDDRRVLQLGLHTRLADEAVLARARALVAPAADLHRDFTTGLAVLHEQHLTHAAGAEETLVLVARAEAQVREHVVQAGDRFRLRSGRHRGREVLAQVRRSPGRFVHLGVVVVHQGVPSNLTA